MSSADRPLPDDPFDRVIRRAAGRHLVPGPCPDPAELAALIEGTLSSKERTALETHASGCERCSAELATLARLPVDDSRPLAAAPDVSRRRWGWRWAIPLATAVVVFAVWSETRREFMRVPMRAPQAPAVMSDGQARSRSSQAAPAEGVLGDGAEADADAPPAPAAGQRTEAGRKETPVIGGATVGQSEREDAAPDSSFAVDPSATGADRVAAEAPSPPAREPTQERQSSSIDATARSELRETAPQAASEPLRDRSGADEERAGSVRSQPPAEPAPSSPAFSARLRKVEPSPTAAKVGGLSGWLVIRASDAVWVRANGSAIERTTDAGRTWQTERQLEGTEIATGVCPSTDVCWLGGPRGLVLRREPSGHWADVSHPGAGRVERLEATDANHATLTTSDGVRLTTTDGGRTWSPTR